MQLHVLLLSIFIGSALSEEQFSTILNSSPLASGSFISPQQGAIAKGDQCCNCCGNNNNNDMNKFYLDINTWNKCVKLMAEMGNKILHGTGPSYVVEIKGYMYRIMAMIYIKDRESFVKLSAELNLIKKDKEKIKSAVIEMVGEDFKTLSGMKNKKVGTKVGGQDDDIKNPKVGTRVGGQDGDIKNPKVETRVGGQDGDIKNPKVAIPVGGQPPDYTGPNKMAMPVGGQPPDYTGPNKVAIPVGGQGPDHTGPNK